MMNPEWRIIKNYNPITIEVKDELFRIEYCSSILSEVKAPSVWYPWQLLPDILKTIVREQQLKDLLKKNQDAWKQIKELQAEINKPKDQRLLEMQKDRDRYRSAYYDTLGPIGGFHD